jgi:hypothetical protein
VERAAAGVAGQPAGQCEQPAAQGACNADGGGGLSEHARPAEQVVRERCDQRPGGVGVKLSGGEVRERLVFEVADHKLDDGVLALLGLDERDRLAAVGREREVLPVRKQLGLDAERANATDDQPAAAQEVSAICASPLSG